MKFSKLIIFMFIKDDKIKVIKNKKSTESEKLNFKFIFFSIKNFNENINKRAIFIFTIRLPSTRENGKK